MTIIPKLRRWLSDTAREPFFLFLHAFDVHSKNGRLPYDSPDGFNEFFTADYQGSFDGCIGQRCASQLLLHINREVEAERAEIGGFLSDEDLAYIGGLYDGGVRYVDREIVRFVELLHETGLYDPTLLVVLADHGEELGEHGKVLHGNPYEEFVRIPLLMKLPGSRHAGRRIGGLASMLDVMPTLLDLLGVPATSELQGISLRPEIETGETARAFVATHGASIRSPRWKLVTSTRELFDLVSDPRELENLFDARPEVIERLSALREEVDRDNARYRERLGALPKARDPVSLSPHERERLRDLGYLE